MKIKRKLQFSRADFKSICAIDCLGIGDAFCLLFYCPTLSLSHSCNPFCFISCCFIHHCVWGCCLCAFARYTSVFIGSEGNIRLKYNAKLNLWSFMNAKCEFKRNFRGEWNSTPTIACVVSARTQTLAEGIYIFRQKVENNCIQLMDVLLCVNEWMKMCSVCNACKANRTKIKIEFSLTWHGL